MQGKIQNFRNISSTTESKGFMRQNNLPETEDTPQKVEQRRASGIRTGAILAGGAVVGCFALALWNRKTLAALIKNRGQRRSAAEKDSASDVGAIY